MEAQEEMHDYLTPQERMTEDGAQLQRKLDQDSTITLTLERCEPSPYNIFLCDASECLLSQGGVSRRSPMLRHRIKVSSGGYYHVCCLESMLNLPRPAPSRFMLDTKPYRWNHNAPWTWGLMFHKWFDHSGQVELEKIATYFQELDSYFEERDDWSTRYLNWQAVHRGCKTDCGVVGCRSEPSGPLEPDLRDCTTKGGQVCPLSDLLDHPDSWRWILL